MIADNVVVIEKVEKKFGDTYALKGVSHVVKREEIHVLLGPNGSGKSTLLKILAGILKPDKGRAVVLGKEPYLNPEVKKFIGYCPQENLLYESLTGFENLVFYAGLYGLSPSQAKERARELSEILGLDEWFFRKKVKAYSGGMAKRASLAVSLVHDPQVLIMDEPTSGLDPQARRLLWDAVDKLRNEGKTVILATHIFEDAEVLADKVVVMHKGRVVAVGGAGDLKRKIGCRYALELEFSREPEKDVLAKLKKIAGESRLLKVGNTIRLLVDDASLISKIEEASPGKLLNLSVRRISLGDVYFALTGVELK